jgi:hypothetical protein
MIRKKTYIVSTYDSYEWITTKDTYSLLLLKLEYVRQGYNVWNYPMWLIRFVHKHTGKNIFRDVDASFEKYVPGSDQITHWSAYDNFR